MKVPPPLMRLAYQFQGQRFKVTRSINADTHLPNGKAYELQTWYTDGGRRPASATGAMTSKNKGQGHVIILSRRSWPTALPVSLESGGGIPCRPNPATTPFAIATLLYAVWQPLSVGSCVAPSDGWILCYIDWEKVGSTGRRATSTQWWSSSSTQLADGFCLATSDGLRRACRDCRQWHRRAQVRSRHVAHLRDRLSKRRQVSYFSAAKESYLVEAYF